MGRSHKERDAPRTSDPSDDLDPGKGPQVGHGEPLPQDWERENTGSGVVLNEWPADDRKPGEGPSESPDPEGGTNAKP